MATVTGLTAERMLEIEAASVVDGDVSGNDLILTRKDGSIINAGNVRGPIGPEGPMGSSLDVITAQPVLDVGMIGQIRAGRPLTPADFTNMGLEVPIALWGGSNFNDSSGNGRHLTNKGGIPLGAGIQGLASTAFVFSGSTAQAAYISDPANGPFALRNGSIGIWHRTGRKGYSSYFFVRSGSPSGTWSWYLGVQANGTVIFSTFDGTNPIGTVSALTDVCDDRWHFIVATFDGAWNRVYVDGALDQQTKLSNTLQIYLGAAPVNIGGFAGDASTATSNPSFGRASNAFVLQDVLSEEQVYNLYCASIPHALGAAPASVSMTVRRKRRGRALVSSDFPAQPARLYNFTGTADVDRFRDEGSNNTPVVSQGGLLIPTYAGVDGAPNAAAHFSGAAGVYLQASDAGMPSLLASRSYGCWFKTYTTGFMLSWGTYSTGHATLKIGTGGIVSADNAADQAQTPGGGWTDGIWHHAVAVEDNGAVDGYKRKLYVDGNLVAGSTVMNSIALSGAFRIGALPNGAFPWAGDLDGVFVYAGALTYEQVRSLYDLGSDVLSAKPVDAYDHIETIEAARMLAVFDKIESCHAIDLAVAS